MAASTQASSIDARSERSGASLTLTDTLRVICLSPQPWRIELPTNRQQVMARVAASGHDVWYVETASFVGRHLADLVRGPDRRSLLRRLVGTEVVGTRIRAAKAPALLPWGHRFRTAARINAALTSLFLRRRVRSEPGTTILWLYDPCFAECIGVSGEDLAVYDCVDDYAEQADPRRRRIASQLDTLAASRADLVFTTARELTERHRRNNAKTHLVGNVADYAHFSPAADRALAATELTGLARPVLGFVGNMLSQKVDFELLEALAARRPGWSVVLVGPAQADTAAILDRLSARDNVRWLGTVPYEDLPRYVAVFDVGIIPYLSNAYTRSCFPLKTFEYLAAGKPVVASGLPELATLDPHVALAGDAEEFLTAVDDALGRTSTADVAARQSLAAANTWETRTSRLLELVTAEL